MGNIVTIDDIGTSGMYSLTSLLKHYGLKDTEFNRMKIIKNVLNEFDSKFKNNVPYLKW